MFALKELTMITMGTIVLVALLRIVECALKILARSAHKDTISTKINVNQIVLLALIL